MITLSSSKIDLWYQCQLKFYAHCILGLKGEYSFATEPRIQLGSLLHRYFQDFYKNHHQVSLFEKDKSKLENLLKLFETEWKSLSKKLNFKNEGDQEAYFFKGQKALKNFFAREESRDFHPPLYIEQWFNFPLSKVKLNGRIDRIDREKNGKVTIIDYKITDKLPNSSELKDDLQLTIYHLACQNSILNETPSELILYYPVQGETFRTTRTSKQLESFEQSIEQILAELDEKKDNLGLYATNPAEWKCNSCRFKANCPEHSNKDLSVELSLKEAEELAEKYGFLLSQKDQIIIEIAQIRKKLKTFMLENKLTSIGKILLNEEF
ncbi:MAG: PD-(D/E)XK nuclease family protein [Candidatus Caenarcaniphilales bacterium]|nr:PD-(D/E)XK nuclease family protein [Candidatus Caenarcaniphilales bacterium]